MKKSDFALLLVSGTAALSLLHGCAGQLDNPASFVDLDASMTIGAGGSTGNGGSSAGAGGSAAGAGGSSGSAMPGCPQAVTYLMTTCGVAGCHGGAIPLVGLDLSNVGTGQQYVGASPTGACANQPLIDSANPQNSLLYLILQNQPPRPACGLLMPYGSPTPIAQTQQMCILQWIESVAAGGGGGGTSDGGTPDASMTGSTGAGGTSTSSDATGRGGSTGAGGATGTGGAAGRGGADAGRADAAADAARDARAGG